VEAFQDGTRKRHVDQVGVFERGLGRFDATHQQGYWGEVVRDGRDLYPVFRVKSLHRHVEKSLTFNDIRTASLNHCNMVAMLVKVLCDVVGRVRTPYHDCFLAFTVGRRAQELRRMYCTVTLKTIDSLYVRRKVGFAAGAGRLDNVSRVECT